MKGEEVDRIKAEWYELGRRQGIQDLALALRTLLELDKCPHCEHEKHEHD